MTAAELDFMIDFTKAFERRWRDVKSRDRCMSIEHRYQSSEVWDDGSLTETRSRYGEDAMVLAMLAWADIPREPANLQDAIKISFGIGAKSQTAYENRLSAAIGIKGLKELHQQTDLGLELWLNAIKTRAENDFELLFKKLN